MSSISYHNRWTFWSFTSALAICYISIEHLQILTSWHEEIAIVLILLLGIPHGALDHIIFQYRKSANFSGDSFIFIYLNIMMLYIVSWMIIPHVSFILFLLFTAYHFGQSQLSDVDTHQWIKSILYMSWGVALLGAMLYFNYAEFLVSYCPVLPSDIVCNLSPSALLAITGIATLFFIIPFIYLTYSNKVSTQRLVHEFVILCGIALCFYALPLLLGFSLYFNFLHSFRVLNEEYDYLKTHIRSLAIASFIKKLLPLSVLSVIGIIGIIYLGGLLQPTLPSSALLIIAISILTLPHILVMEGFYGEE